MRDLVAGERVDIDGEGVVTFGERPVDLALIALDAARGASPAFPPIDTTAREMRPAAAFGEDGRLLLRLDRMPGEVDRLLLVAFDPAARPLARAVRVEMADTRFTVDLATRRDAAVILVEVYRYRSGWRLAANGQGFEGGLVVVAATYRADADWARRLGHAHADHPRGGRDGHPPPRPGTSSGSGVAVGRYHVLSNAHVVDGAERIDVVVAGRALPADLVFSDPRNDLALLRVEAPLPEVAGFRARLDLHLGEDVVVLGFPLQGLLGSGPQASAGNVAALCGIGNDSTVFQFSAPIASGNSGGPILDMAGAIVGLVNSSLDLDQVRRGGASAQNINFGIKGAVIRSFLDAFGCEPQLCDHAEPLGRAAVVRRMRETVVKIACRG